MGLWQEPFLNLYHHWLMEKNYLHIVHQALPVDEYAAKVAQQNSADIVITGTYRSSNNGLQVDCMVFQAASKGSPRLLGVRQAQGAVDKLVEWVDLAASALLRDCFPEMPRDRPRKQSVSDVPIDAFRLSSAAIDCMSFEGCTDAARYYTRKAIELAPNNVYLRFVSTLTGMNKRDASFCSQLLADDPSFVPAYFPDQSTSSEDVDELLLARRMYLEGLSLIPFNVHGYYGLRQICVRLGDALSLIPFAKLHVVRGTFSSNENPFGDTFATCIEEAAEQGQYDMARELFDAGMGIAEDPVARSMLFEARGWCEQKAGNLQDALILFQNALSERPSLRLRKYIADVYYHQRRYNEAVLMYAGLLRHRLSRDSMLTVKFRLARSLEQLGRYREAITIYNEICGAKVSSGVTYTIVADAYNELQLLTRQANQEADGISDRMGDGENVQS